MNALTQPAQQSISIIVPMYNEAQSIGDILSQLTAFSERLEIPAEIIVVDDGSTDASREIAASHPVRIIPHRQNKGYGAAIKTGIKHAQHPYVILFDADGQHPVSCLPDLVAGLMENDAVIGERKLSNSQGVTRMMGKLLLKAAVKVVLGLYITDLNCGLRGFKKEIITRYLHLLPDGYSASSTSTLIFISRNYSVRFLPIVTNCRKGSSNLRVFRDGLKAFNQILRMGMLFEPWRIFGTAGILSILLGSVYAVWYFLNVKAFPSSGVMLITSGVSSIFFGLLMDQIAEIRKEKFED